MARHWLRGLWVGAIVGIVLFLLSLISVIGEILAKSNLLFLLIPDSSGLAFLAYPLMFAWLVGIGAIAGVLIGLAFKKKKR